MICSECGATMRTSREDFHYLACGLSRVHLMGLPVTRCPNCGEYEVSIPNIEGLHTAIASMLTAKTTPLAGEEVRFLRKSLGWSGVDFARHMGVTPETVSRWEHGSSRMEGVAERLLRLMVVHAKRVEQYPLERLKEMRRGRAAASHVGLKVRDGEWRP